MINDNNSRRNFLKKMPLGLGLTAGVFSFDSHMSPAMADWSDDPFEDDTGFKYFDAADRSLRIKTWTSTTLATEDRHMEMLDESGNLIYQGSIKSWRLARDSYRSLDGLVLQLYGADGKVAWADTDNIILDAADHHNHDRYLAEEPDFSSEDYELHGETYEPGEIYRACWGRISWRPFSRVTDDNPEFVGVYEIHILLDNGDWYTWVLQRYDADQNRDQLFIDAALDLETIRHYWRVLYRSGITAGAAGGTGLATAGAYLAGAVTVKGGSAVATGAAIVPPVSLGLLFLVTGASLWYANDQAVNAMQELAKLLFQEDEETI